MSNDIQVTFDEKVNRAASVSGSRLSMLKVNYIKEILDGIITVINYKFEPVTVVIKIQLHGQLSNFSLKPKIDAVKSGPVIANAMHDLRWEVQVDPQQTLDIKYSRTFNRRQQKLNYTSFI
ncbi:unnamed protein product, partial [Didymodactylos carnosus]